MGPSWGMVDKAAPFGRDNLAHVASIETAFGLPSGRVDSNAAAGTFVVDDDS